MKMSKVIGYIIVLLTIFSCTEEKTLFKFKRTDYNHGGYVYHMIKGDSIILDIGFSKDDNLKYVLNFISNHDQIINFYENTGVIMSKLKKDNKSLETNGRAYYFYDNSGNLSGDFNFNHGIKVGSAVSYHDSTDRIKEIMLYNDIGELFFRKTFDEFGNLIKTEGSRE